MPSEACGRGIGRGSWNCSFFQGFLRFSNNHHYFIFWGQGVIGLQCSKHHEFPLFESDPRVRFKHHEFPLLFCGIPCAPVVALLAPTDATERFSDFCATSCCSSHFAQGVRNGEQCRHWGSPFDTRLHRRILKYFYFAFGTIYHCIYLTSVCSKK